TNSKTRATSSAAAMMPYASHCHQEYSSSARGQRNQRLHAPRVQTSSAMRPQFRCREAKTIAGPTIAAEESVTAVKTNPRRENVLAYGSIDIRHNLSIVSAVT